MKIVSSFILVALHLMALTPAVLGQPMKIFGTRYDPVNNNLQIIQVTNPTLGSGNIETIALDVATFTKANGKITGNAPNGTVISGTSLNAAAYDPTTFKFYFRDQQGSGPLYSWTVGATTIAYVSSAANMMPGNTTLLADNATIYKGGLWYGEDNTDTLYRYDLALNTVRRFANVSGGIRSYDFGDIAVSSAGLLYINGNLTHGGHNGLDKIDISAVTATSGTVNSSNFTAIADYGSGSTGATQQIFFDNTGANLFAVQSINGQFNAQTWHQINTTTGVETGDIWTSTFNYSDLASGFLSVPEPSTIFLLLGTPALMGSAWYFRNRKKLEKKAAELAAAGNKTEGAEQEENTVIAGV